ncbi:putative ubiquitin specific protease, papain-like cysteine peptidase superfamily [Plasmopara halstedii]
MTDYTIQCVKDVSLEVTRDDGDISHTRLQTDLVLRKEVGNARLVSGDSMIWVGKSLLYHKDSTLDSVPTRTVHVENGKRRFVFTIPLDAAGKIFFFELKRQVDGVDIQKKKRKIRKQLSQSKGFTPTNTFMSPKKNMSPLVTSPHQNPTMALKRSPLTEIGSPRLLSPLPIIEKGLSSSLTSPLRSPFRSPFRKKPRLPQSPSSCGKAKSGNIKSPLRSPAREWLSPVRSLKLRNGPTPPHLEHYTSHTSDVQTAEDTNKDGGEARRKSITGSINRRVRSLQLLLDDESSIKEAETHAQKKITSHFLQISSPPSFLNKTARELDMSAEPLSGESEQLDNKAEATISKACDSSGNGIKQSTHGLLNLGNYCYMNAIVQALAVLPEFVRAVRDEDNMLKVIRKHSHPSVKGMTIEQIKKMFDDWRTSGDTKHLILQYTLNQILQSVINGSNTSINPEPLKNVMGKKNPIFATYLFYSLPRRHYQQDAHEFLLNLVTEFEQELLQMVHEITTKIQEEANVTPQVQKGSLMKLFCSGLKAEKVRHGEREKSSEADSDLVCCLPPAKCFRAEFNRTLTCRNCAFSRKQAETFYDFSLDLPYHSEPEPIVDQEPQSNLSPERQCYCNLTPVRVGEANTCYHCCPNAACSYREKVVKAVEFARSPVTTPTVPPSKFSAASPPQPPQIKLETLIEKHFETEVLELACEKCIEGKTAESAYQIKSLPSVLVFHLKRFEVNPQSGSLFKRCDPIVPPAIIDMTKFFSYTTRTEGDSRYILKSVIHHLGRTIDEGHYVADVCDANGQWIRRNDTHESMISEDYALQAYRSQESCYMFFYAKMESSSADSGKENVPVRLSHQDENDEVSSQRLQKSSSRGINLPKCLLIYQNALLSKIFGVMPDSSSIFEYNAYTMVRIQTWQHLFYEKFRSVLEANLLDFKVEKANQICATVMESCPFFSECNGSHN